MKSVIAIVLIGMLLALSVWGEAKNKDTESAQIAFLEIDGEKHEIIIGEKVQLKIGDKLHSFKVNLDPYRLFNKAGLSFKYSSRMGFSFDPSTPGIKAWSIDGDN